MDNDILIHVLRDIERFAQDINDPHALADAHIFAIVHHGVPYDLRAWYTTVTAARRMLCSRALRRLESHGLLERVTDPSRDRVRYVRPTKAGIEHALSIPGANIDKAVLMAALGKTTWYAGDELSYNEVALGDSSTESLDHSVKEP